MSGSLSNTLLIALGGAVGSVARYWVGLWMVPYSQSLPLGTILINIVGSFLITFFGALTIANGRLPLAESWRLFFMVGICGGFTTFSSFSLQTLDLLRNGMPGRALVNIAASVIFCLIASTLGYMLAQRINGGVERIAQMQIEEEVS